MTSEDDRAWSVPSQFSITRLSDLAVVLGARENIEDGMIVPPLWHWSAMARWAATTDLGTDGHPRTSSHGVPSHLSRRMYGGGEVTFHAPVRAAASARASTEVLEITPKKGRTGELCVVAVETKLVDDRGALLIDEIQRYVYRAPEKIDRSQAPVALPSPSADPGTPLLVALGEDPFGWKVHIDATTLLRFSAATANSHRIHYDWPYATQTEGYPGLVVHGPLMSLILAEVLRRSAPSARVRSISHRNLKPLWSGESAATQRLDGSLEQGSVTLGLMAGESLDKLCSTLEVSFDLEGEIASHRSVRSV